MTFFDKKEDVLEIELTQFGKYRLSQGGFDPVYYAFFDNDIIYDVEYAGLTNETGSNQNSIEPRIKDAARTRVQHVHTGIESQVARNIRLIRTGEIIEDGTALFVGKKDPTLKIFEPVNDNNFSSYAPLGTSALTSDKAPAWNISFYKGNLNNTSIQLTSSARSIGMKIPQLDATIEYKTFISSPERDALIAGVPAENGEQCNTNAKSPAMNAPNDTSDIIQELYQNDSTYVGITAEVFDEFPDDSYIKVSSDDFLFEVQEVSAPFTNDNFDIEVFELTSSVDVAGNTQEQWAPLYFRAQKDQDDNYYEDDDQEGWIWEQLSNADSSFVEYFMEVNTDREIPEEDLCPVLAQQMVQNGGDIYETEIVCPDLDLIRRSQQLGATVMEDTYESTVKEEDIGDCD